MRDKNIEEKAWRQTLYVDKKQLQSFNKDIPKLFPFSMTVSPWAQKISKLVTEYELADTKIAKQQKMSFQKLAQIASDVNSLRQILKFYDQTNEYLVKVQSASQITLAKLQNFRSKMGVSYQQLAEDEQKLNDQLELLNRKIEGIDRDYGNQMKQNIKMGNKEVKMWEKVKNPNERKNKIQYEQSEENQIAHIQKRMKETEKEVEAIQKIISGLGRNLGWSEEDHNDFLSIWTRGSTTKNYFQIEQELQGYFQFYTAEEIKEHMNKYMKWKKLNEEKKELIIIYKNIKEQKKIAELKLLNLEKAQSKQKKDRQQQRRKEQNEQQKMKVKINQWKQIKNREKKQIEEIKIRQQQQRRRLQAMKRLQIEQKNKQLLERWKIEEAQKKQNQIKRVKSARKPIPVDKQAEQRIRARQAQLVQKKMELYNQKKNEQEYQKYKEQKVKEDKFVKFSHVINKLQHKTAAIKQKERQKFDGKQKKDANTFGGQLLMTGVRATPAWMKGM